MSGIKTLEMDETSNNNNMANGNRFLPSDIFYIDGIKRRESESKHLNKTMSVNQQEIAFLQQQLIQKELQCKDKEQKIADLEQTLAHKDHIRVDNEIQLAQLDQSIRDSQRRLSYEWKTSSTNTVSCGFKQESRDMATSCTEIQKQLRDVGTSTPLIEWEDEARQVDVDEYRRSSSNPSEDVCQLKISLFQEIIRPLHSTMCTLSQSLQNDIRNTMVSAIGVELGRLRELSYDIVWETNIVAVGESSSRKDCSTQTFCYGGQEDIVSIFRRLFDITSKMLHESELTNEVWKKIVTEERNDDGSLTDQQNEFTATSARASKLLVELKKYVKTQKKRNEERCDELSSKLFGLMNANDILKDCDQREEWLNEMIDHLSKDCDLHTENTDNLVKFLDVFRTSRILELFLITLHSIEECPPQGSGLDVDGKQNNYNDVTAGYHGPNLSLNLVYRTEGM